jgi:type IV pilus assembly protein PilB
MAKFDKKMGAILSKHGLLSEEDRERFITEATQNNSSLSKVLIEKGVITETDILGCLSQELNSPAVDLTKIEIPTEVKTRISEDNCRHYQILPISEIGGVLTVAVANPFDIIMLDDIRMVTGADLMPVISTDVAIERALSGKESAISTTAPIGMDSLINDFTAEMSAAEEEAENKTDEELENLGEDSNIVKMSNMIIYNALKLKASDIHFEPFEKRSRLRYRLDGACQEMIAPPKPLHNALMTRFKILAKMDIAERKKPQDGKIRLMVEGRKIDFRVSVLPMIHGEKVCIRILDTSGINLKLEDLGFEPRSLADFRWAINAPYGMLLVTGPTGSGKSTTLYSALKETLNIEDNVATVENPVEYQMDGINQCQIEEKRGLTFAAALRSILRQDPNTIMVGEIRDQETVSIAIKAALTGRLVLSTLHTNDAPSTITRLIDMGVERFNVASATVLVSAQRLLRKLCTNCKKQWSPPVETILRAGVQENELEVGTWFQPPNRETNKCPVCNGKGYKGRFAILETLTIKQKIKRIIVEGGSALDVEAAALEEGMITLRRCAVLNAMRGKTSVEEVLTMTRDKV